MKNLKKISLISFPFFIGIFGIIAIFAATSPALDSAGTFAILSSTFTNSSSTTITGDIGYTTPPVTSATLIGNIHMADSLYNQAGLDQANTLANLNSQVCTFNFAPGAIDLATDITHTGAIGVYAPGVYCITGAASIGTAGIVLEGTGTYIFRISGALTSADNSNVTLSGSASNCDVFWTPGSAVTLGVNTLFNGIIISPSGITIGANATLLGMALAYGGTVTTDTNTITAPICSNTANLHIIKNIVNGPNTAGDFNIHIKYTSGSDIIGSPANGTGSPGRNYSLSAGNYIVSEDNNSSYTQSFAGDCDTSGNITLYSGDNKTCTITNTYIVPVSSGGGGGGIYKDICPNGDYSYSYYDKSCGTAPQTSTGNIIITTYTGTITNTGNIIKTNTGVLIDKTILPITKPIIPIEVIIPADLKIVEIDKINTRSPSFPDTGFSPKEVK